MSVVDAIEAQPHEFDIHLHFTENGLQPYYALDAVRKDHDWDGKPTAEMSVLGCDWALCFDYDSQPLRPWSDPEYQLTTTPLFRIYFVARDSVYDGERADRSQHVKGGTLTVRPRWPDMKKETGEKIHGYMDIGEPYLDVQVQASNIDPRQYLQLVRETMAAFDVNPRYFEYPADTSNINDCAVYVRVRRDESGPLHAPDGLIARTHNVLTSDRDGYRKHVEDNRKLPGYYVTTTITDQQASDVIRGHRYGKEVKHYHPENPDAFTKDEFGYHPKLEISFQTSLTDETVYWDNLEDLLRELDETLLCYLEWSGLSIRAGDYFVSDAYFDHTSESQRSRKLLDCPLPAIEDEQEQTVISLWRNMTQADEALVEELMTDGSIISPAEAADKTGYTYRTIRESISRLEGFIRHTYGEVFGESIAGIHAKVEFADGRRERIRTLSAEIDARKSATAVADETRRWENVDTESVDWDAWAEQERQRATR